MKRLYTLIALLFIAIVLKGQAPASFNYQAVLRDSEGILKANKAVTVKFEILSGSSSGTAVYTETHNVTTSNTGLIDLDLGTGTTSDGSLTVINWGTGTYFLKITIDGTVMGTSQLLSVPYALFSAKAGNVFSGNYADLTNKPALATVASSGSYTDLTDKPDLTVGAVKKLTVTSETADMEEALFEVKNKNGQTVFAVYNEGVRIYVDDGSAKGTKGGFAIGSFGSKAGSQDYFVVNPDSIRIYVADAPAKGAKGGFAIGGFGEAKALPHDLLVVSSDSIRAYIDTNTGKGSKGGFAIGGFGSAKGPVEEYLRVTRDSTRVYINNTPAKAPKGGFAIGSFGGEKGIKSDYLLINPDSTNFYVRSLGGSTLSTFNILSVNENLIQNPLMSADPDTIAMTSVLNVQNNIRVVGDIGYAGTVSQISVPVLTSEQVISVTETSGVAGGTITTNGGAAIITSGVCWSILPSPTVALGTKTTDGSSTGSFTSSITGLTASTTYYVRAYATNSKGTGYGQEIMFITNSVAPVLATVTTVTPGSITYNSAFSGGDIIDNGGAQITVGGICWSTSPGPLVTDTHTTLPYPQSNYASALTGLTENTTYYVRAYATSVAGTAYGNEISFTTTLAPVAVNDIDGNSYNTIIIGSQTWFASNLKTTRLNDGTAIANVTDGTAWSLLSTPAYAWYNNDNVANGIYGILYNWQTVNTGLLCPAGWQVPAESDMFNLEAALGGSLVAGGKLKETGTLHWSAPNTGATDEVGFTALPGGFRNYMGMFINIGLNSSWWTSSLISIDPTFFSLDANSAEIMLQMMFDKAGMYVRCMKNN